MAGHGPATSNRPAAASSCRRARCAGRACCRAANASVRSYPSITYHTRHLAQDWKINALILAASALDTAPAHALPLAPLHTQPDAAARRPRLNALPDDRFAAHRRPA
ncbi:hypothetical protein XFF6994_4140004 [Xanthomonas citri pv. fuscans]|nr:hypothetical protein XFF6994_4140004 [Xanthomonas citri pv. fuscans]